MCGAISSEGKITLAIIQRTMNAEGYLNILETHLLPFTRDGHVNSFLFMQDNAAVHMALIVDDVLRIIIYM